jgi:hypothetical protein
MSLIARTLFLTIGLLAIFMSRAEAQTCGGLFISTDTKSLVHPSWELVLEHDYEKMTTALGAVGAPIPKFGVGKLLYQHWKQGHETDAELFRVGFTAVEPSALNPNEVARFVFPTTYLEIVRAIEGEQGANPTFKIATYGDKNWLKLDEPVVYGFKVEPESDLEFLEFATMIASGYVPLWPTSKSMGFLHDLTHITEYLEFPDVFPALQTFFSRYLAEGWQQHRYYRQRAEVFNEFSYVLKPSRYEFVSSILVSGLKTEVPLAQRVAAIAKDLRHDPNYGIAMTKRLTASFNDIFERHGGGSRDFYSIDNFSIPPAAIERYVEHTKSDPSNGIFLEAVEPTARIEALESLEGINRQIIFAMAQLEMKTDLELIGFLAYRAAQLEAAIVAQRALSLTQVDLIRDSMQPLGVPTKTRTYFKAFQPEGSHHHNIFVGGGK